MVEQGPVCLALTEMVCNMKKVIHPSASSKEWALERIPAAHRRRLATWRMSGRQLN